MVRLNVTWFCWLGSLTVLISCQTMGPGTQRGRLEQERMGEINETAADPWDRVLVTLRIEETPGEAPDAPARKQRISDVRTRLLDSLSESSYRVLRSYATLPVVALEVSRAARNQLEGSALVKGLEMDRLSAPSSAGD